MIAPVVQQGRQNPGMPVMPPLPIPPDDVKAIAAYIHSVTASARGQGAPPEGPPVELNIVVGDAKAGQAVLQRSCTTCHSAADMQGIATRVGEADGAAELLGRRRTWWRRSRRRCPVGRDGHRHLTPQVEKIEGRLIRLDDFTSSWGWPTGRRARSAVTATCPRSRSSDPREAHRKLLPTYADKDIHDVTAYLVTLK